MRSSFTNLMQILGDKARAKDKDKDNLKTPGVKRNSISPSASRTLNALPRGLKLKLGLGGTSPAASPDKSEFNESVVVPDISELLMTEVSRSWCSGYSVLEENSSPNDPDSCSTNHPSAKTSQQRPPPGCLTQSHSTQPHSSCKYPTQP
jgi:hypothetical protein